MYPIRRMWSESGPVIRQNQCETGDGEKLEFLTFPSLEETGLVRHLFTTRLGGVSQGELAAMNLSFTRGDQAWRVEENYRRIGEVTGVSHQDMVASHQTHTTNIRRVTDEDRGKGITRSRDYCDVDGLMTNVSGIALVTYFADCVPLFFVDTVHRAVGLAHSGWRGSAAGMGACMVRALGEAYGTRPQDLLAAIGPSICADCYEVGEEVAEQFRGFPGAVRPGRAQGKYQLDLREANRQTLLEAGVRSEKIAVADLCTCCNSGYLFSHRASGGKRGNMAALLGLR